MRLGVEDAGEVLTLQRAAYVTEAQAHGDTDLPPLRQVLSELAAELADPAGLALGWRDARGRLVAAARARVIGASSDVAEIGRLTVAPDRQGQRLGTRLLAAIEAELPAGVTGLRLFTGERSEGNLRLYARAGYTETGRQPTGAGYSLVHLSKPRSLPADGPPSVQPVPADLGLRLTAVTLDCDDVVRVAQFWSALLGLPLREPLPGWRRLGPVAGGPLLTFQPVGRTPGRRPAAHVDLTTSDGRAALARVVGLGGALVEEHRYDEGVVRVVADPEGHAFCLVQYAEGSGPA